MYDQAFIFLLVEEKLRRAERPAGTPASARPRSSLEVLLDVARRERMRDTGR